MSQVLYTYHNSSQLFAIIILVALGKYVCNSTTDKVCFMEVVFSCLRHDISTITMQEAEHKRVLRGKKKQGMIPTR